MKRIGSGRMDKEKKWIKRIQKKADEDAANALVAYYYQAIFGFVYKQTLNKDLSLDLTQEIFISMLQSIRHFDGEKASFKTWLYRIAANRIVDYFRSRGYKHDRLVNSIEVLEEVADHELGNFTLELEYKDEIERVVDVINTLDAFSQQVVRLKLFSENTFTEIAVMLDRQESSVKTRYYAVLKTLRERLEARR